MKIAFVSQGHGMIDPPKVAGSISIWTYEVINELKKNHTIVAYEMEGESIGWRKKTYDGVKYYFVPNLLNRIINKSQELAGKYLSKLTNRRKKNTNPSFASVLNNLGYIVLVAWHLRQQKCDIVHIHQYSQFASIIRLFNPKVKIVLHMNCEWLSQLDRKMIRRRIEKTDLVLGCSDYIVQKIKTRFPEIGEKVKTVYNGVNHLQFKTNQDDVKNTISTHPRLLFVGRVSPEKGIHILIEAVGKLVQRFPTIQLDIVGGIGSAPKEFMIDLSDDPKVRQLAQFYPPDNQNSRYYYEQLMDMASRGIKDNIHFVGGVPYQKVIEYYHNTDILINPSFSESFGMSLAEAMAAEKPVVATRVGGMVNVIDEGKTGLLVDAGNVSALADAISKLIEDPDLSTKMGKAGRKRILNLFSWQKVALSLEANYQKIM